MSKPRNEQYQFRWQDHYETLQVHINADPEVISAAYRKLAQMYHPDRNSGDPSFEERLKKINEAYEVLSDPRRRNTYDQAYQTHYHIDPAANEESEDANDWGAGFSPLVRIASSSGAVVFHDQHQEPYMALPIDGKLEVWPVHSRRVKSWLTMRSWAETRKATSAGELAAAQNLLASIATFDGPEQPLHVRVAWHEDMLWYDLGDGRAVKLTGQGWEIVEQSPVIFKRFRHQLTQATPVTGGDFAQMFQFAAPTLEREDALLLSVATLAAMVPSSPRPAISLAGAQGSGKSIASKVIKRVIDPSTVPSIRRIPDFRELQLQLEQNWVLNIDNVTQMSPEISDALASAITSDSDLRRHLYTDQDLLQFDYMRPVILNGISHAPQRADLLDRSFLITLQRIPGDIRVGEEDLWPAFETALLGILGGAFDILSKAITLRPKVRLNNTPRMADFAAWGYAIAEAAGWGGSAFLIAYHRNIEEQHREAIAASPLAQVVIKFIDSVGAWQGPVSSLKVKLEEVAVRHGLDVSHHRSGWPRDAARLSKELRRHQETLRAAGAEVSFGYQGNRRAVRLRTLRESTVGTVGNDDRGNGIGTSDKPGAWQEYRDGTDTTDGKIRLHR